jgi:hypothetical protein
MVERFKKLPARAESSSRRVARDDGDLNLVPDAMQPGPLAALSRLASKGSLAVIEMFVK